MVSARGGFSLAIVENRGETAWARTYRCQVFVRRAATLLCSQVPCVRRNSYRQALRHTCLNIAPLRSRLRSAARHPQRAADTRRAIHNSTAVGVSEAIPASVPFAETPPREGPATRLMTRPLHRERSDERTRRPRALIVACGYCDLRGRAHHRERACGPAAVHQRPGIA